MKHLFDSMWVDGTLQVDGSTTLQAVSAAGNISSGVSTPKGRLHLHDGIGGKLFASFSGIAGTPVVIIPDGAGDVTGAITGFFVANDGGGAVANSFTLLPSSNLDIVIGTLTLRLAVAANGQLTAVRQAGTGTATLVMDVIWQ